MLSYLGVNVNEMKCFKPPFYIVRTKLNQGYLGLMRLNFFMKHVSKQYQSLDTPF